MTQVVYGRAGTATSLATLQRGVLGLYEGGGFVSNSHAPERSCLWLVQGVMGRLLAIGDPTLGASQGICLLTLSRLAVAELLPSPGALAPVGIKGCKGSSDIAPLISTPMSEGLAGK